MYAGTSAAVAKENDDNDNGNLRLGVNVPIDMQSCLSSSSSAQSCPNLDSVWVKYTYVLIDALNNAKSSSDLMETLSRLLEDENYVSKVPTADQVSKAVSISRKFTDVFNCNDKKTIISYNTRLIELDEANEDDYFHVEDYKLLSGVEKRISSMLLEVLSPSSRKSKYSSDDFLRMISFIGNYGMVGTNRFPVDSILEKMAIGSGNVFVKEIAPKKVATLNENGEVVEGEDEDDFQTMGSGDILIHMVVDPLSLAGQRAASLMKMIRDQLRLPQIVIFTPKYEMTGEFPLQNFYRYVMHLWIWQRKFGCISLSSTQHTLHV